MSNSRDSARNGILAFIKEQGPATRSELLSALSSAHRDRKAISSELERRVRKGIVHRGITLEKGRPVYLHYLNEDQLQHDRNHKVRVSLVSLSAEELIEEAIDSLKGTGLYGPASPVFLDVETIAAEAGLASADVEAVAPALLKKSGWRYYHGSIGTGWKVAVGGSAVTRAVWNLSA